MEKAATILSDRPAESGRPRARKAGSTLASIDRAVGAISPRVRLGLIVVAILFLGNLDLMTGNEISFSIFYLIPISVAARFHEQKMAIKIAIFAGLVWLLVELLGSQEFSHPLIPLWNAFGRTVFFLLLVGYITEIYQRDAWLEAEVASKTAQLRDMFSNQRVLEREMAQAVAREHSQIARELHDGVGQYLAGLSFQARALADELERDGSPRLERAGKLVEKLTITNRMLRRLDHVLSPSISGEGGLAVALSLLAADVRQFSGVDCAIQVPEKAVVIGEFQALTLFRIAQEAISNSIKHSGTGVVRVQLAAGDSGLRLLVEDDGRGFTPVAEFPAGEGFRIMRHRAELIGAKLHVTASPGAGCSIECLLPWRGASTVSGGGT